MLYAQASTCTKATVSQGKVELSTVVTASVIHASSATEAQQDGIMDLLDIYPETDGFSGHSCTVLPIPNEMIVKWALEIVQHGLNQLSE